MGDNKDDEVWHGSGEWRCVRCGKKFLSTERHEALLFAVEDAGASEEQVIDGLIAQKEAERESYD